MSLRTREDAIFYAIVIGFAAIVYLAGYVTDIELEKLILVAAAVLVSLAVLTYRLYLRITISAPPNDE